VQDPYRLDEYRQRSIFLAGAHPAAVVPHHAVGTCGMNVVPCGSQEALFNKLKSCFN
jgi:hypothetical protein